MLPRPFFVPGVSQPTKPLLSRPTKAAVASTPSAASGDNIDCLQHSTGDAPSVALNQPYRDMSFANEVQKSTTLIKELSHTELRAQFPYMKTEDLEKLLTKAMNDLMSGLAKQKQKMRNTQSRTNFFSMSAELRNTIYEMALRVEDGVEVLQKADVRRHTALLRTSKQIYEEARSIWYAISTFKFDIGDPSSWPQRNGEVQPDEKLFPLSATKCISNLGVCACWIKSVSLEFRSEDAAVEVLANILKLAPRHLDIDLCVLTKHQAVLNSIGLPDVGWADSVFTMVYRRESSLVRKVYPPEGIYQAAGVHGDEEVSSELLLELI